MAITRRHTLRLAGIAATGTGLAGCLASGDPGASPDHSPTPSPSPTEAFRRIDSPPHRITEPSCASPDGDHDPLWLCADLATEPSLAFEQARTSGTLFSDEGLQLGDEATGPQVYATLLTGPEDLDRLDRDRSSPAVELAEETDFGTEAVLVVQTGWGSGSVAPHLQRIEPVAAGIHAHGCYRRPCVQTADFTSRTVVARFERPAALDRARVSLTLDPETRVHVRVGDGVVTVDDLRDRP